MDVKRTAVKKFKRYASESSRLLFKSRLSALKIRSEIVEHLSFVKWASKRIFLPISFLYIVLGFIFHIRIFDSLFVNFLIFVYSNFLPDLDSVFKKNSQRFKSYKQYLFLFFAPLYLFYLFSENSKKIYSKAAKPFHNFQSLFAYGLFLSAVGLLFYGNWLEIISIPLFGVFGYAIHLSIDGYLRIKSAF